MRVGAAIARCPAPPWGGGLQIEGTGWDIGQAVRFLLSDHGRYIMGHTLVVDGGAALSGPERASG